MDTLTKELDAFDKVNVAIGNVNIEMAISEDNTNILVAYL